MLDIMEFKDVQSLHTWLVNHYKSSEGIWVRLYRVKSNISSATFLEVLEEEGRMTQHGYDALGIKNPTSST